MCVCVPTCMRVCMFVCVCTSASIIALKLQLLLHGCYGVCVNCTRIIPGRQQQRAARKTRDHIVDDIVILTISIVEFRISKKNMKYINTYYKLT